MTSILKKGFDHRTSSQGFIVFFWKRKKRRLFSKISVVFNGLEMWRSNEATLLNGSSTMGIEWELPGSLCFFLPPHKISNKLLLLILDAHITWVHLQQRSGSTCTNFNFNFKKLKTIMLWRAIKWHEGPHLAFRPRVWHMTLNEEALCVLSSLIDTRMSDDWVEWCFNGLLLDEV